MTYAASECEDNIVCLKDKKQTVLLGHDTICSQDSLHHNNKSKILNMDFFHGGNTFDFIRKKKEKHVLIPIPKLLVTLVFHQRQVCPGRVGF